MESLDPLDPAAAVAPLDPLAPLSPLDPLGPAGGTGSGSGGTGSGGPRSPGLVAEAALPEWLRPVARAASTVSPRQLSRFLPPPDGGRPSAVLVLFGEGAQGPELLLLQRATSLREHAGQSSFPGGAIDPEDGDPLGEGALRAALREAQEETGLDPAGVRIFATLPRLYIPVSGFVVTPVLAWWRDRTPVGPVDPAETARVFTVPIAELADQERRGTAVHPSGFRGPCFLVADTLVWGFTAGVIDRILHYAGWERPWDTGREVPLDHHA
ncbi:CoA pyrophosphatase [Streptomyces sp. B6B3]|uniref:NUDIX hydrolase n=1 Tax=Streptomyces sp. B6B3 TaxID=3153570 RepID=UPI00325DAD30